MILITGTPRCGTHYTAALLQSLGLRVLHESVDADGAVSWKHLCEGVFIVSERNRISQICDPGFKTIIHQVRNPLKSISSMQTLRECTWSFLARHIDLDMDAPVAVRGMQCWVGWNMLAETKAEWRYRIEDIKSVFPEFLQHLKLPTQPIPKLGHEKRESRVERFTDLTWGNLVHADEALAQRTAELARKYGYDVPEISGIQGESCPEPFRKSARLRQALRSIFPS